MSNGGKALQRQRERFWLQDPHCHWCGIKTVLKPCHVKGSITQEERNTIATIDHLHPRYHPDRLKPEDGTKRHVLACWKCNNDRDTQERAVLPKEWFYERGCSKPLSMRPIDELKRSLAILRAMRPKGRKNINGVNKSIEAIESEIENRQAKN